MLNEKQREQTAARQQRYRERQQEARRAEQAAKGLPALPGIPTLPGYARWRAGFAAAQALEEQVCEEMESYYDDRSETWQDSEAGTLFTERQEAIGEVLRQLEELTL
jgi:hypothetical protein